VARYVEQTLAVLGAGKRRACAVPMATAVHTRASLFAQDVVAKGGPGPLTFLRGTYFQDLEGAATLERACDDVVLGLSAMGSAAAYQLARRRVRVLGLAYTPRAIAR